MFFSLALKWVSHGKESVYIFMSSHKVWLKNRLFFAAFLTFFLPSFVYILYISLNNSDLSVWPHSGADIVQWLMKNLSIEDPGKAVKCTLKLWLNNIKYRATSTLMLSLLPTDGVTQQPSSLFRKVICRSFIQENLLLLSSQKHKSWYV